MVSISQQKTEWKDRECSKESHWVDFKYQDWRDVLHTTTAGIRTFTSLLRQRNQGPCFLFQSVVYGYINLNINDYVSFVDHGRTRLSQITSVILTTFKSSYFNRIVKPWNIVCKEVNPETFYSPISFRNFLKLKYSHLVHTVYDVELPCTWSLVRDCPCHGT
jgi:hypothetical protein